MCVSFLFLFFTGNLAAARASLPVPVSVCSIYECPNNGMVASVWGFLSCMQMLRRAVAQVGCTDTEKIVLWHKQIA